MKNKRGQTLARLRLWQKIQSQQVGNGEQVRCVGQLLFASVGRKGQNETKKIQIIVPIFDNPPSSHTICGGREEHVADEAADAPLVALGSF